MPSSRRFSTTSRIALVALAIVASALACGTSGGVSSPLAHELPHTTEDGGASAVEDAGPRLDGATPVGEDAAAAGDAARVAQLGDPCDPDGGAPCPGTYPGTLAWPLFCETWGPEGTAVFSACSVECNPELGPGYPCARDAGMCVVDGFVGWGSMCEPAGWCSSGGCAPPGP